jgi:sporulation protein YlmC with PRC-barrel domain
MKFRGIARLPAALLILSIFTRTEAQQRTTSNYNSEIQRSLLSRLKTMTVENRDGEKLGVLSDFVIDLPSGNVKYAIVSGGGFLGLRPMRKTVPLQALSDATAKTDILALDVSTRRWKNAPQFRKSELGRLRDPQYVQQITAFYFQPPTSSTKVEQNKVLHSPSGAGPRSADLHSSENYILASEIVGRDVLDQQQRNIGQISDLLIDLAGSKKPFAILSRVRLLKKGENYALPLRLLARASGHHFNLETMGTALRNARPFSEETWQTTAANSTSIYHYAE